MTNFVAHVTARQARRESRRPEATTEANAESHADKLHILQRAALDASGLFDTAYYREAYPDTAKSKICPEDHFLIYGDGCQPNPYLSPSWYFANYPDVAKAGTNPLVHYAVHGEAEGRRPSLLFDPTWYRTVNKLPAGQGALAHYLAYRCKMPLSPIPEFDADYYAAAYPDVAAAGVDLFEHYIRTGINEGRHPSTNFDARYYARRHMEPGSSENAFLHYLAHKDRPGVHGKLPKDEKTVAREVRAWSQPGSHFEERHPLPPGSIPTVTALAYYLPQFHAFEENDRWWGKGFTEWTNLIRGQPRYVGHYQPRIPRDLGFYRLDSVAPMREQARMAREAGISGFIFYYYWFNGKRLMKDPVDRMLDDPATDIPFALMWANENWTRRWDGAESDVLISQDYRPEDDLAMVADFARHFADTRYIRLGGRPLMMIYRAAIIPNAKATMKRWRAAFRDGFGEDPIMVMAQAFDNVDPRDFGFDGAIEFPPHKLTSAILPGNASYEYLDDDFTGKIYTYDDVVAASLGEGEQPYPLVKTAVPGWDNDARRQGSGLSLAGSTPAKYEAWMRELVARARARPFFGTPIVCINAWNEWCEGAYLEPDVHYGAAYLNATSRALASPPGSVRGSRIALIGHDAFPSGAQHLLLNIGKAMRREFGIEPEFVLLSGGAMLQQYEEAGSTTICQDGAGLHKKMQSMAARGTVSAIVNTAAAARAVVEAKAAGIRTTLLVHEMGRIVKEMGLTWPLSKAMAAADVTVFGAKAVMDDVMETVGATSCNAVVRAQGSYQETKMDLEAGARFRLELGVPEGNALILGAGYADMRKGFDLFIQVWRECRRLPAERPTSFAWLGAMDPTTQSWLSREICEAEATGTFHAPGFRTDMAAAMSAADAFALTSREDPLPTVVMEAMRAGLPTFAFEGTGGIPGLMRELGDGVAIQYIDAAAMGVAIIAEDAKPAREERRAARARRMAGEFGFADYAGFLADTAMPGARDVSVVVPSFNYERFMAARLASVLLQDRPIGNATVLDDASTDGSAEAATRAAKALKRAVRVVTSATNSGSVFKQWRKAADDATGKYIWIAEADDLSDPTFLSSITKLLDDDPRMAFAFCDSRSISHDGKELWPSYKPYYATIFPGALMATESFDGPEFVSKLLSVRNVILNVSAVVWRTDALAAALRRREADLIELKMAGDWLLYMDAAAQPSVRVGYEAEPLNAHRRHAESVTHALEAEKHLEEIARCHAEAARLVELPPGTCETQRVYLEEVRKSLGATVKGKKRTGNVDRIRQRRRS